jgi:hypothetical protein
VPGMVSPGKPARVSRTPADDVVGGAQNLGEVTLQDHDPIERSGGRSSGVGTSDTVGPVETGRDGRWWYSEARLKATIGARRRKPAGRWSPDDRRAQRGEHPVKGVTDGRNP